MNSDSPPDRLAIDPESPHFDQTVLERGIGIRFKGAERTDVEEYSMSEGWVRVALGKKVDRRGRSEEHTSELQSLMRISYAVFCLKKKKKQQNKQKHNTKQQKYMTRNKSIENERKKEHK